MPLYFFDIDDNGKLAADEFGIDLADIEEARDQALSILPDIARDEIPDGETHEIVCLVRDATKRPVYRATLTYWGERL